MASSDFSFDVPLPDGPLENDGRPPWEYEDLDRSLESGGFLMDSALLFEGTANPEDLASGSGEGSTINWQTPQSCYPPLPTVSDNTATSSTQGVSHIPSESGFVSPLAMANTVPAGRTNAHPALQQLLPNPNWNQEVRWARQDDSNSRKVFYVDLKMGVRMLIPNASPEDTRLFPLISTQDLHRLLVSWTASTSQNPTRHNKAPVRPQPQFNSRTMGDQVPDQQETPTDMNLMESGPSNEFETVDDIDWSAPTHLSDEEREIYKDQLHNCSNEDRALLQGEGYTNKSLLDKPGEACQNPKCKKMHGNWPTSGELIVLACMLRCEVCGTPISSAAYLRNHVRSAHTGPKYQMKGTSEHRVLYTSVRSSRPIAEATATGKPIPNKKGKRKRADDEDSEDEEKVVSSVSGSRVKKATENFNQQHQWRRDATKRLREEARQERLAKLRK